MGTLSNLRIVNDTIIHKVLPVSSKENQGFTVVTKEEISDLNPYNRG